MSFSSISRNPINTIRHQLDANIATSSKKSGQQISPSLALPLTPQISQPRAQKLSAIENPAHNAFWAEGTGGKGGEKPWKFSCLCGEVCSSYENYRYHPVGRMYECTNCSLWSHVKCVLGSISDDDLEELTVSF